MPQELSICFSLDPDRMLFRVQRTLKSAAAWPKAVQCGVVYLCGIN